MKTYIGTKLIKSIPMNRLQYNEYRGWKLPDDEKGSDEGFLVEYIDGGAKNHPNHEGYISWSPKDVFDKSYFEIDSLTFGMAIEAMRLEKKVARTGWNEKGMFLYLVEGREEGGLEYGPYIAMKTAQGNIVPWLASQTDVLSEDWQILD